MCSSPYSSRSRSTVRGPPDRPSRVRPSSASTSSSRPSNARASSVVSSAAAPFRKRGWSRTGPTGSVSRKDETATTSTSEFALSSSSAARKVCSRSPRLDPRPMYARTTRMMTLAGLLLLLAAPARAGTLSLVEARPAATPFLQLTGARELSAPVGLWRVKTSEVRQLRRAGLVRLAEPERRLVPQAGTVDPLLGDEWWFAPVGASQVVAPGPGVPVAVVDTGLDLTHPEFAQRPNTTPLNTQSVVDTTSDFHGTAVASVVGAPVNDIGMVGVYPQAALYSYDADLSGHLTLGEL